MQLLIFSFIFIFATFNIYLVLYHLYSLKRKLVCRHNADSFDTFILLQDSHYLSALSATHTCSLMVIITTTTTTTIIIIIIRVLIIFVPPLGRQHWRLEATFYHRQYKLRQTEGTSHHQHWYHHPRPRDHHWYHHFPICTQLGRRQHFNLIHYTNTNAWLLSFIITN